MDTVVLGWVLIALGVIAVSAGVVGGISRMLDEIKSQATNGAIKVDVLPIEFLKALAEFLKALTKAPTWLALIAVGFVLIAWGGSML
jgi:hypothetical protein